MASGVSARAKELGNVIFEESRLVEDGHVVDAVDVSERVGRGTISYNSEPCVQEYVSATY